MVTLVLYGKYKKKFGWKFKLNVRSFPEAIRLMEANFPGMFAKQVENDSFYIASGEELGKGKHINYTEEMLHLRCGPDETFHLIPAGVGSAGQMRKKGLLSILLGAVLIGASFFFTGGFASTLFYGGLSLVMGGASLLLSPEVGTQEEDKGKSYSFSGPANISEQGSVKPLVYGRAIVGSVAAAGSIRSTNQ